MIRVYDSAYESFESNGLAVLEPAMCEVSEEANGMFELELEHPITDDMKWLHLERGNLLRAPVPVKSTPRLTMRSVEEVPAGTRVIWRVKAASGYSRLYSRPSTGYAAWSSAATYYKGARVSHGGKSYIWPRDYGGINIKPPNVWKKINSPSAVLQTLRSPEEYEFVQTHNATWHTAIAPDGTTGFMLTARGEWVRDEPEIAIVEGASTVVPARQVRDQLFRIYEVERDTEQLSVRVKARHISYDLLGVMLSYSCKKKNADVALAEIMNAVFGETDFSLYTNRTAKITGEWEMRNVIEALLDPDEGFVRKLRLHMVRDNYDVFLLRAAVRDRGVVVSYGKNLLGVTVHENQDNIVTRLIPTGEDADGHRLFLPEVFIDSEYMYDYPMVMTAELPVPDARVKADGDDAMTEAQAFEAMRDAAAAEFEKGIDLPTLRMDVDFVQLGDTAEYAQYKRLQRVFLFDTITLRDERIGLTAKVQVSGYTWDAIAERYTAIKIGDVFEMDGGGVVAGYQLPSGSIGGTKLVPGSVGTPQLRDLSVVTAKIQNATITGAKIGTAEIGNAHIKDADIDVAKIKELNAAVITATVAEIGKVTSGEVTTNALYAKIVEAAAIEVERMNAGTIDVSRLTAAVIMAAVGEINKVLAAEVETTYLYAAVINAITAEIANIKAEDIETSLLYAALASVVDLAAKTLDVDFARIKDLVANEAIITQGAGGDLYIARLRVTEANMLRLTVGELIIRDDEGQLYRLSVDESGNVETVLLDVDGGQLAEDSVPGGALLENSITARELAVETLFADEALMVKLFAGMGTFGELFAESAVIPFIKTAVIASDALQILVGDAVADGMEALEGDVEALRTAVRITPSGGVQIRQTQSEEGIDLSDGAVSIVDGDGVMVAQMSGGVSYFPAAKTDDLRIGKYVHRARSDGGVAIRWEAE